VKLFGTDGIRGVANCEPITSETITQVGRALAVMTLKVSTRPTVLIGKDTRLSGYMIETALATGICSMGVDVLLVGPLPTAGIAWLTRKKKAARGVTVTASHNPYQDNGIKIFDEKGYKISREEETYITELVEHKTLDAVRPIESSVGKAFRVDAAMSLYTDFLIDAFPSSLSLKGLTLVIDCANGASYQIAPKLFEQLGAKVISLGISPDGKNINEGCGTEHPKGLQETVVQKKADLGIALDGDADRCVLVDEKGALLDGDSLMGIVAIYLKNKEKLKDNTIVLTEMSNTGFLRFLNKNGIQVQKVPVGDQNISAALRDGKFAMGGEQSGHLLFSKHSTTVDGLITALQILTVLQENQTKLSEIAHPFKPWPQILKNIPVTQKPPLETLPSLTATIQACEIKLHGHGRLSVRYSGTQPLLRIMVEAEDKKIMNEVCKDLEKTAKACIP